MSSPGSIFISYRRSDSIAETDRIYDRLVSKFGRDQVYKDVDNIPLGSDFAKELDKAVSQCQVLLVIIGKTWITVTEPDGTRRLENPDDFVRIEVESALKQDIPVIPVLLEGASMPKRTQLPESLHPLARRNATQVGYDPRFHSDMDRLERGIEKYLSETAADSSPKTLDLGNGVSLDLVHIPGGTFLMGSPVNEEDSSESERPQHKVTVPEFWMGKFPVTQAQYEAVMGENPSQFTDTNHPVEYVSWYNAIAFCEKASKQTGMTFRLPSEAEWEYACRAGTTTPFHFSKTITTDQANYNGNYVYGSGNKGVYRKKTTSVKTFPPNKFGLHDMHGNVYEWCQDHWHADYNNAPQDGSPWIKGWYTDYKIVRGGSWDDYPGFCRSAYRFYLRLDIRRYFIGFRVVCSAPRSLQ